MGPAAPKRTKELGEFFELSDPERYGRDGIDVQALEDFVRDAITENDFHDLVLLRLVELTVADVQGDRPLFANLIDEPAFYRKCFKHWVSEALEERRASEEYLDRTELLFRPFQEENGV